MTRVKSWTNADKPDLVLKAKVSIFIPILYEVTVFWFWHGNIGISRWIWSIKVKTFYIVLCLLWWWDSKPFYDHQFNKVVWVFRIAKLITPCRTFVWNQWPFDILRHLVNHLWLGSEMDFKLVKYWWIDKCSDSYKI